MGKQKTLPLTLASRQSSNLPAQHISNKDDNIEDLFRLMRKISRTALPLAEENDNIEDLFRLPRRSEQTLLTAARTFHRDSASYNDDFLDYDLPASFRADPLEQIAEVKESAQDADAASAEKSDASGAMLEICKKADKQSRRLDGIIENKHDNDPQKLAERRIASHLKASPQRTPALKSTNKARSDSDK